MIDPRFANAGTVPFAPGYGAQQVPIHQHHRRRHHQYHKNKPGGIGDSPLSHDESIHKVDHGHHHIQQNEGPSFGGGYGVPYGADGFGAGGTGGFYPQHQQFGGGNYGFGNQYHGNPFDQDQFGGPTGPIIKHRRRHHRHHRQAVEAGRGIDQTQWIPEQLIGQRSSSAVGNEGQRIRSPVPSPEGGSRGEQWSHRRHRHHHHRGGGEHGGFSHAHQSRYRQGHTSAGADGYGHLNDDLIFIERGEHSPHRQEPPAGYEYKGKIEVQGIDRELRSRSGGQGSFVHTGPTGMPIPPPVGPPPVGPPPNLGPCPPGWQQMILTAAPGGPCPPGSSMYTGQLIGSGGMTQGSFVGIGGFARAGSMGGAGSGDGLANLAASLPIPPQGQLVADYIVGSSAGGGITSTGGSGFLPNFPQPGGGSFTEQQRGERLEENVSGRATIIEVWQKRAKHDVIEELSPRRSPRPGQTFDFEQFRSEILSAIERIVRTEGSGTRIQWTGHDGGTQTQIHPNFGERRETEIRPSPSGGGEVRVIVQPIQPVFYMPRQTEAAPGTTQIISGPTPAPAIQQTTSAAAPHVVYVPRNVYVPVIKPVFVPRERVIVRPQVIHVARPVLVDRPVPVTQRPIIIDRERPIPVPVRSGAQGAAQSGGTKTVKEEYVYRDNLPVAYGGRCAEFAGGVNYGYMPTQQEHQYATQQEHQYATQQEHQYATQQEQQYATQQEQQYATSSMHEMTAGYEAQGPVITQGPVLTQGSVVTQGPVINVAVPEQYQHSHSGAQLNVQQGGGGFHESYANLAQSNTVSGVDVAPLSCTGPIEVLDATVNPSWQRTDKTTLVRRYGRPAYDICQKTDEVEQQMYRELRQRSSSVGVQRSDSAASYISGSGVGINTGGFAGESSSFSTMPLGDMQNYNSEVIGHQGPVCVNY